MSTLIAPSILSADFAVLGAALETVAAAGADWIHLDVMDGHFVPNLTFGPPVVAALRPRCTLPFDAHLMVEAPERLIDAFAGAGVQRLTVHAEACRHLHRTIQQIRQAGMLPGVALNPATPLCQVEEVLADIDLLLLMTVNPGFGGQRFIEASQGKIRRARRMIDEAGLDVLIQVDGGVKIDNAARLAEAGADVLVSGSALFGCDDPGGALHEMRARLAHAEVSRTA